jgi:hypothetical protein
MLGVVICQEKTNYKAREWWTMVHNLVVLDECVIAYHRGVKFPQNVMSSKHKAQMSIT